MDKKLFYTLTSLLLVLMCTKASFTQENKGHLPKLLAISPNFQHISSQKYMISGQKLHARSKYHSLGINWSYGSSVK
ncbi:MAG: hypothetical protein IPG00_20970 [Saprospiraceae bacterium]|nr:hypothetical protein [Saprospiraceae bacterium]